MTTHKATRAHRAIPHWMELHHQGYNTMGWMLQALQIPHVAIQTSTEDGGTIKIPLMQCLTAREASRNEYGCCTYATTKASYIGTTTLQTNTNTSRYNYGRRRHHQNTFDAMPNSSRSKPQQVWMLYLCDDKSVVHRDNKPTNEYKY